MKVSSWWVVCGCSLLGCASVPNSEPAVPLDVQGKPVRASATPAGLRVSGEELAELASRYFGVLEVTFENPTAEWIHLGRPRETPSRWLRLRRSPSTRGRET